MQGFALGHFYVRRNLLCLRCLSSLTTAIYQLQVWFLRLITAEKLYMGDIIARAGGDTQSACMHTT